MFNSNEDMIVIEKDKLRQIMTEACNEVAEKTLKLALQMATIGYKSKEKDIKEKLKPIVAQARERQEYWSGWKEHQIPGFDHRLWMQDKQIIELAEMLNI